MIFHYKYYYNISKIVNLIDLKKLHILDFGCGLGNWKTQDLKKTFLRKITFFDKDKKLLDILKKRYKSKKAEINFNYRSIIKKNYNLIVFSSVIQYIPPKKLRKIIFDLSKNKKHLSIMITDIPFLPRPLELIFLPLFSLKRFIFVIKLIFSSNYKKMNYFLYKKKDFKKYKSKFSIKYFKNLHDLSVLRYSLIMRIK